MSETLEVKDGPMKDLMEAMKAKGFTQEEAEKLLLPFCEQEYRSGYQDSARRMVQYLNEKLEEYSNLYKLNGIKKENREIGISIEELTEVIIRNTEL